MPDDEEGRRTSRAWLPISIAIGTTLAVGIPVLMLRKAKAASVKLALENPSAAPPPRRALPSSPNPARPLRRIRPLHASTSPTFKASPSSSDSDYSPSIFTALSHTTTSNALLAGKAFLIATTLVGVGAFIFVSAVQHLTGTYTVPDFARQMRYLADKHLSGVKDRIYRGPENDEERHASREAVPFGAFDEEEWSWEESEKRLKRAYDEGGFTLWTKVALRELEAEARMERAKRRHENVVEENARSSKN